MNFDDIFNASCSINDEEPFLSSTNSKANASELVERHGQSVFAMWKYTIGWGEKQNYSNLYIFQEAYPDRYIECFIAEQNMVGVAIGAACRDRTVPFVSTFAAFLSRAYDQIRMAAVSQSNINMCGSHCGVSIGKFRIVIDYPGA